MTTEFEGRLFPKEAADAIGIAPATLRKYSQIIEDVIENPDFFTRTEQNNRTYSANNIELLKLISKESSETKKPVKTIVETIKEEKPQFFDTDSQAKNETKEQTQQEDQKSSEAKKQTEEKAEKVQNVEQVPSNQAPVQEFLNIINQQNQKIDQLMQMVASLSTELQDVKPMIAESQHLLEEQTKKDEQQVVTEEKVGFFKRLFGSK